MVKLCIASILSGASYREKNAAQMLIHHWQVLHPMDVIKPEATSDSFGGEHSRKFLEKSHSQYISMDGLEKGYQSTPGFWKLLIWV